MPTEDGARMTNTHIWVSAKDDARYPSEYVLRYQLALPLSLAKSA